MRSKDNKTIELVTEEEVMEDPEESLEEDIDSLGLDD